MAFTGLPAGAERLECRRVRELTLDVLNRTARGKNPDLDCEQSSHNHGNTLIHSQLKNCPLRTMISGRFHTYRRINNRFVRR